MRGDERVAHVKKLLIKAEWLVAENIENCASDTLFLQSLFKCSIVQKRASTGVYKNSVAFHHPDHLRAHDRRLPLYRSCMQRYIVTGAHQFRQRETFDIAFFECLFVDVRRVGIGFYIKAAQQLSELLGDVAVAYEAELFVLQLVA